MPSARTPAFRPRVESLEARDVPAFGVGGFVSTNLAHTTGEAVRSLALQPDGKIVAAGTDGLARYNPDGNLDTTFNAGGAQPGVIPITDPLADVAIQPDGKIVVGGSRIVKTYKKSGPDRAFVLMRFNPNGTPDAGFGANGSAVQAFGKSTASDAVRSVTVQPDGKIVAVGLINSNGWGNTNPDLGNWGVARFNPNGTLDRTFDGDGWLATVLVTNQAGTARTVTVQPDGKIVVGGDVFVVSARRRDAAVVRYLPSGALDTSFGGTGRVLVDFAPEYAAGTTSADELLDLALQADGRIVFAGASSPSTSGKPHGLIGRLNPDGTVDATFGGDGRVVIAGPSYTANGNTYTLPVYFVGVAVRADGRIVAWSPYNADVNNPAVVARVDADGILDPTFDGDGFATLTWPEGTQAYPDSGAVLVQPDGKIVVGGGAFGSAGVHFDLARLNADGTLDA